MRLHAFLEYWGLINFNVDPIFKPNSPLVPKAMNYKSPMLLDVSPFLSKESNKNLGGIKVEESKLTLIDQKMEEVRSVYPISGTESIGKLIGIKGTPIMNQINFLSKNFRFKCDNCRRLCGLDFFIESDKYNQDDYLKTSMVICEECHQQNLVGVPNGEVEKERRFIQANIFNILSPHESKSIQLKEKLSNEHWSEKDLKKLVTLVDKYGEDWIAIEKEFEGTKSKNEIITQFLQLPIKEQNLKCPEPDLSVKMQPNGDADSEEIATNGGAANYEKGEVIINPLVSQISFFTKMFDSFVNGENGKLAMNSGDATEIYSLDKMKEIIYKTYAKTIDNCHKLQNEESSRMKMIIDLLIFTQMKKIELKLDYFNEFERIIEFESNQMKTLETSIIQDRVKFSIRKLELSDQLEKLKNANSKVLNNISLSTNHNGAESNGKGVQENVNEDHMQSL